MNIFKKIKSNKLSFNGRSNVGFTLIEVIIVVSLFLIITGASLGAFISVLQNQKKILSKQQFINQISYIEEYMSKAMRMAKTASSNTNSCNVPAGYIYSLIDYDYGSGLFRGIKFLNSENNCQQFQWNQTLGVLEETVNGLTSPLTSTGNFAITSIRFSANGSDGSDAGVSISGGCDNPAIQCGLWANDIIQPRITILFNIMIPGESEKIIQTTISQRNLNIKSTFVATPIDIFPAGWSNFKQITINHTKVDDNLTNFPILVKLNGANFNFLKSNGFDIRFTDVGQRNFLDYERVTYDTVNQVAEFWVKIPFLSSSNDTIIYMYYNNPNVSLPDGANSQTVWSEGYKGVWHAKDVSSNAISDSSFYENHGSKYADNFPLEVDGIIGKAQSFDGVSDYIKVDDDPTLDTPSEFTLSGWVKRSTTTEIDKSYWLFGKWQDWGDQRTSGVWFASGSNNAYFKPTVGASPTGAWNEAYKLDGDTSLIVDRWYYITGVYDGSNLRVYVNGEQDKTKSVASSALASKAGDFMMGAYIGSEVNYVNHFKGILDEVRLSDTARSASWVRADYYYGGYNNCGTGINCVSIGGENNL